MNHTGEVRVRRRAFFGGEALSSYFDGRAAMGLVAMLAYPSPRGITAMVERLRRGLSAG